eukprot:3196370-Rhodomonas_salina.1
MSRFRSGCRQGVPEQVSKTCTFACGDGDDDKGDNDEDTDDEEWFIVVNCPLQQQGPVDFPIFLPMLCPHAVLLAGAIISMIVPLTSPRLHRASLLRDMAGFICRMVLFETW